MDIGMRALSEKVVAILDLATPGTVSAMDVPPVFDLGVSQSQPNAVRAGSDVFIAWRTESSLGSTDGGANAEELWLKRLIWNGATLDLGVPELPLPRSSTHRVGDQRLPAFASGPLAPLGQQLVTAFDDLGRTFGGSEDSNDVVVEAIPVPLLRLPGDTP
jgi:hypothetical protein